MAPELADTDIRRYLLGLLPEAQAEALEHEYFARPEVLERVRAVEDDLLDDYAAGRLDPEEMGPFHSRYVASPLRLPRVVAARALRLAAGADVQSSRAVSAPPWRRWLAPLAVAAGVLLTVIAVWRWPLRTPGATAESSAPPPVARSALSPPAPVVTPTAGLGGPPTPQPAPAATRVVLALAPTLLRGQGDPPELRVRSGTDTIVLELEGDPEAVPPGASRFVVLLQTVEGARVWSGRTRRADDPARPSRLASVEVPAATLPPGDYLVTLSAADRPVYRYFVRVRPGG